MSTVSRKIQYMLLSYSAHWNVVLSLEAYSPVDPGNTSEEGFEWNEVFSDGFYIEKVFQKRDGSCSNGSHPCKYNVKSIGHLKRAGWNETTSLTESDIALLYRLRHQLYYLLSEHWLLYCR